MIVCGKAKGKEYEVIYFVSEVDSFNEGVKKLSPYLEEKLEREYRDEVESMEFFEVVGSDLIDCVIEDVTENIFFIKEEY